MPHRDTLENRFWKKVDRTGGPDSCWLWTGARYGNGYGQFRIGGTLRNEPGSREKAHRVSLALAGVDTEGLVTHHTCRVRLCVNPAHLEVMEEDEHSDLHADEVRVWTRERAIAALLECASIVGRVPGATDFNPAQARSFGHHDKAELHAAHGWPGVSTVQKLFGSWNSFVTAAGMTPRAVGKRGRTYTSAPSD